MSGAGFVHVWRSTGVTDSFGPYADADAAEHALQHSLLIEGECQDDCYDAWADTTPPADPARLITIDPSDPHHTGQE